MKQANKQEEWQRHIEAAVNHAQGIKGYCREKGLRNSSFHYWKKKLEGRPLGREAFAAVEVISPPRQESGMPDPRWLAEFLRAYAGARQ